MCLSIEATTTASRATFTLDVGPNDLDLYVLYDANNDGNFTSSEVVGSSTGGAGQVTYAKPSMVGGQSYKGEILLGPSVAPTAVSVPVTITPS